MKNFKSMLVCMTLAFSSISAFATDSAACADHLRFGAPSTPNTTNIEVCRKGYALLFNTTTKTPLWVVEHLRQENVYGSAARQTQFSPDPEIPFQFQAKKSDYARTGYDQGHMAPAADFSQDQELMNQSFYFSNVVPQNADNNRHIWASLEKKVRTWLGKRQELYVITGPVFKGQHISQTMGASQVAVPDFIFKIIYDANTKNSISFMIPNQPVPENELPNYIVTMREVEVATGLNFFTALPPKVKVDVQTRKSGMWTR